MMHPNKSPGTDGFTTGFYQRHWELIGGYISNAVLAFLNGVEMEAVVNSTVLILIPKVRNTQELTHFRPISLCNVLYKMGTYPMQTPPPVQTMQTPTGAVRSRSDCSQQIKGHFTIQRPPAHHRCLVIMRKPPCRHHRSIGNGVDSLRIVSCVRLVRSIAASPALALELRRRPRCSRRPLDHRALPALRSPPC
jgi:hypothetical protein